MVKHIKQPNIRKTTEQFIKEAQEIHGDKYDYSLVVYVDIHTKVKILCKIHGLFEQLPNNHLKSNCPGCSKKKKKTTDSFIEECKLVHGDEYDYHKVEYKNLKTKVTIICNTCNTEFKQTPNNHLCNKQGCPKCSGKYTMTTEEFIEKAKSVHGDKYDYTPTIFINCSTKIEIICKIHKNIFVIPSVHLSGSDCFQCTGTPKKTTEEFIIDAKLIHGDKYDYSKVVYNKTCEPVIIICKKHGEYYTTPNKHLSGGDCSKCITTSYSKKQIEWLEYVMKIDNIYIQHHQNDGEYKIPGTKYKVDGYCKKNNTVYQFHGSFYHGNPRLYDRNFINPVIKKTMGELYDKTCTIEKNIRDKGYNLIIMWEDEWDKLKKNIKNNTSHTL